MSQLDFAAGPSDWLAVDLAQDRVGETGRRTLSRALDQLYAFMNRGMRGDTLQIAQLVDAHAQRNADFQIEARGAAARIVLDQEIELRPKAQYAESDLRGEAGIAGIEGGRLGE